MSIQRKTGRLLALACLFVTAALCAVLAACQQQGGDAVSGEIGGAASAGVAEAGDAVEAEDGDDAGPIAAAGEEWPGQSKGYVGPNGEGSLSGADFQSDEEYGSAVEAANGGWEQDVDFEWADDSPEEGALYAKGVLSIGFYKTCSENDAHEIVESRGGEWARDSYIYANELDWASALVQFPSCDTYDKLSRMASEIEALEEVKFVELETPLADDEQPQSISAASIQQTYLYYSRFHHAWDIVECDHDVTVAVIDRDFDLDHPDLAANILFAWDAVGGAFLQEDRVSGVGHGTAVAGVISAVAGNSQGIDGLSYNAWLMLIARDDADGNTGSSYTLAALQHLAGLSAKPDVVNMSFGDYQYRQSYQDLITLLHDDYGVVFAASAGNDASTSDHYPSGYDGVISVASIGVSGSHSSFSNTNATVDLCAVGEGVYTTVNPHARIDSLYYSNMLQRYDEGDAEWKYVPIQGTSFSAPQVAAAAALLVAQHPGWTSDQIESRLESTAKDLGASGRDDLYGYGALDAAAAVGWTAGGSSPFTGPGDNVEALDAQVDAQERLQATGASDIPGALVAAMEANPDVSAWLYVPATNLSLPVAVRERGDSFYLDHDADGEPNGFGCAFSAGGSRDMSDPVTVVYGHSFSDVGLAFTQLHKFEDYAFFAGHEKVYLYLPGKRLEYRVVGANLFNARAIEEVDQSDAAELGDYFAELSNPDPDAFMGLKRRFPLDAASDRVLQLSTCMVPANPAHRFVVTCVLEGEREL